MSNSGEQARKPGLIVRFGQRARNAIPDPSVAIGLSVFWGLAMAISALIALFIRLRLDIITPLPIMALFFAGGAVAAPIAVFLVRFAFPNGRPWTLFLAILFAMAACTLLATAAIFALQYRVYYAQWHEAFGTRIWIFQFIFTFFSAVYQFAVFGSRHYLPLGPVLLVLFSLWFARRKH
jgi:hypothetical protein